MRSSIFLAFLLVTGSAYSCCAQASQAASPELLNGVRLFESGKYKEAVATLKEVTKKNSNDANAWFYLGRALLKTPKSLKDATKALEKANALHPNWPAAHTILAYALLLRNKSDDADREANAALGLDGNIAEAFYILGVVRLRKGQRDAAVEKAEAAIKLKPDFASPYLLKSQALVDFFADVLTSDPRSSSAESKARWVQAAESLEKYLALAHETEDQEYWKTQLENLRFFSNRPKPGDPDYVYGGNELTTKARVLSKPEPSYTQAARDNGVTGTVIFRCVFAADGTVRHLLIVKDLPHGLTEEAIKAARRIKFVPATKDGRPVSMFIQLEYNFDLY